MKVVAFSFSCASRNAPMTASLERLSRLPVGSSARIRSGSFIRGARHCGPLLLSAGDFSRVFPLNLRNAEHFQELLCLCFHLFVWLFADHLWHADVFKDRKPVQEHEILEYKAEFLISHLSDLFLVQFGKIDVLQ